jgi:hypothetical protein
VNDNLRDVRTPRRSIGPRRSPERSVGGRSGINGRYQAPGSSIATADLGANRPSQGQTQPVSETVFLHPSDCALSWLIRVLFRTPGDPAMRNLSLPRQARDARPLCAERPPSNKLGSSGGETRARPAPTARTRARHRLRHLVPRPRPGRSGGSMTGEGVTFVNFRASPLGPAPPDGECDHWDHSPLAARQSPSRWRLRPPAVRPGKRQQRGPHAPFSQKSVPLGPSPPTPGNHTETPGPQQGHRVCLVCAFSYSRGAVLPALTQPNLNPQASHPNG